MATNILRLPYVQVPMTVSTDEDWLDSFAFVDGFGNPIDLSGLTINFVVRSTPDDPTLCVVASTGATVNGKSVNGSVSIANAAGGAGGNIVSLAIPKAVMANLNPGSYVHEAQAVADGYTRTIASGPVTVRQGLIT